MSGKNSIWRGVLRAMFWSDDPVMRWLLIACFLNAALHFTPLADSPWFTLLPMFITAANGVMIIRVLRRGRRQKAAHKILKQQGGFWVAEMGRLIGELHESEARGEPLSRQAEIAAQLEEAKTRCEREIAEFQKNSK